MFNFDDEENWGLVVGGAKLATRAGRAARRRVVNDESFIILYIECIVVQLFLGLEIGMQK